MQPESSGETAGNDFRSKNDKDIFSTKKRLSYLPCPYEADIEPKSTGETAGTNFRSQNDKDIFRPQND